MKIAILDDESNYLIKLKQYLQEIDTNSRLMIDTYQDSEVFLNQTEEYDVLLLDIDMPKINGLEVAQQLLDYKTIIIYITNYENKMSQAFDINVAGYVIKREYQKTLKQVLLKAISRANKRDDIWIDKKGEIFHYQGKNIIYIESVKRYLHIYTSTNNSYIPYMTLEEISQYLPEYFVQVNKSQIVNINKIISMNGYSLKLRDIEQTLEISRRRKKDVFNLLMREISAND